MRVSNCVIECVINWVMLFPIGRWGWNLHGKPMGNPWEIHGKSMGIPYHGNPYHGMNSINTGKSDPLQYLVQNMWTSLQYLYIIFDPLQYLYIFFDSLQYLHRTCYPLQYLYIICEPLDSRITWHTTPQMHCKKMVEKKSCPFLEKDSFFFSKWTFFLKLAN